MKAVVFGGSGFIGRHLRSSSRVFTELIAADLRPGASGVYCDVREPIPVDIASQQTPDWIVVLAAVHREPGHEPREYYETNVVGARNVVRYAEEVGCDRIFFMSSTSVYGPTPVATDEHTTPSPTSHYGISKLTSEGILREWQRAAAERRLVICRPGVVYGAGDPGNILRMIHAIRRGMFVIPGERDVRKSYAYVEGLVDSVDFTVQRTEPFLLYNFVDRDTETLADLVRVIQDEFGCRQPVPSLPLPPLLLMAYGVQALTLGRSSVHPVRVRKAAMPTHVVPRWLIDNGFEFRFDFRTSLKHWRATAADDFEAGSVPESYETAR